MERALSGWKPIRTFRLGLIRSIGATGVGAILFMITDHYFNAEFAVITDEPFVSQNDEIQLVVMVYEGEAYLGSQIFDHESI